jgi:hypothetical protein
MRRLKLSETALEFIRARGSALTIAEQLYMVG